MGRPKKQESEKVIRRTFSLYPDAYEEFLEYKRNSELRISDSAMISYLIKKGIKSENGNKEI